MNASRTRNAWARRLATYLLLTTAVVVGLYAVVGFVVLPQLAKQRVPALAAQHLNGELRVHEIRFNPFTLTLVVQGAELKESEGATLASVSKILADLELRPLLEREIRLSKLEITGPWVHVGIEADGKLNLARLLADRPPAAEPAADPAAAPWFLTLAELEVHNGVLRVSDRSDPTPAEAHILPISLSARDLSTRPDRLGPNSLVVGFRDGGVLSLEGDLTLTPPAARGRLTWRDYSPQLAWRFLQDELDLDEPTGRLHGRADYDFALRGGEPTLRVFDLQLEVRDLALKRSAAPRPLLEMGRIALEDGTFDLEGNRFEAKRLRLAGGVSRIVRDQTLLNWAGIVAGDYDAQRQPVEPGAAVPFQVAVPSVELDGISVRFEDLDQPQPVAIDAGDLALAFGLRAERGADGVLQARIVGLQAQIHGLSLAQEGQPDALLNLEQTRLAGGEVDLAASRVALGRLEVKGGGVVVERRGDGAINWQQVFAASGDAPNEDASGGAWSVALERFALEDFVATVTDRAPSSPVSLRFNPIVATATGLKLPPKGPLAFTFSADLEQGGKLRAEGEADLAGPGVAADIALTEITLLPLQAYLEPVARVSLNRGRASLGGRLSHGPEVAGELQFAGGARVDGLNVTENVGGDELLGWRSLEAKELSFALRPGRLAVQEVLLEDPAGKLIINEDLSTNWRDALKPRPEGAAEPTGAGARGESFVAELGRIRFSKGSLNFGDLSLTPPFRSLIHDLNGSVSGLSTATGARAAVDLKGQVNEYGAATIKGELQPFDPTAFSDVHMGFRNLEMSDLTPYSAKFAGYRIASGKLSLDLGYRVRQAQLQGENQILVERLTLGEKVESPDAIDAPLELAIALLEDANGRIDIGLPVTGDLSDPQFSYGHLIWKAIGNLITKVVTAPFRALGAALGVKGEDLDRIAFEPGLSVLPPPEREKLTAVVTMLAERPRLALEVQGRYAAAEDAAALKSRSLHRALLQQRGIKLSPDEDPGPVSLTDAATRQALEALYAARFGAEALTRLKAPAKEDDRRDKVPADQPPAFYESLYARLRDSEPLAKEALSQLARERGQAVVASLTEGDRLSAARIRLRDPVAVEAEAGNAVTTALDLAPLD